MMKVRQGDLVGTSKGHDREGIDNNDFSKKRRGERKEETRDLVPRCA